MILLENILKNILNESKATVEDVNYAIDNHIRVIIDYNSKGDERNSGARVIEVYAYGLTKAGNPVIRAFQPYGNTTTRVPSWKFFRLDRITEWQPTKQTFSRPADFYYKNLGDFNPNGDETMSVVYKIAKFDNEEQTESPDKSEPKTKNDVYKTETETNMERLRQQVNNPIKLSDIKTNDAFKQLGKSQKDNEKPEPKTKEDVYKTDTEIGMEKLKQQLQNPKKIDLSKFERKPRQKTPQEQQKELDKLRNTLKDKQMSLKDLNKQMNQKEEETFDNNEEMA